MTENPVFLTPKQLAARWQKSVQTLANWRSQGIGPPFFKPCGKDKGHVLYRLAEIEEFENENLRRSTAGGEDD